MFYRKQQANYLHIRETLIFAMSYMNIFFGHEHCILHYRIMKNDKQQSFLERKVDMSKKMVLLAAAILIAMVGSASANLITNGSFEDPALSNGSWTIFANIPGWTGTNAGIEVRNNVAGIAEDGNNFVELDSNSNSGMYQTVTTVASSTYTLSYYYAPRQNVAFESNYIELYFDGKLIDSISGYSTSDNAWSLRSFTVTGTGNDTIKFMAAGTDDSYGGSIDNVSMNAAVPEPTSLLLFGTGIFGIGMAAWRKRK
jgi:hypothetical protein